MALRSLRFSRFIIATALISLLPLTAAAQDHAIEQEEEDEEIVVQATRNGRRVQDGPIRQTHALGNRIVQMQIVRLIRFI